MFISILYESDAMREGFDNKIGSIISKEDLVLKLETDESGIHDCFIIYKNKSY